MGEFLALEEINGHGWVRSMVEMNCGTLCANILLGECFSMNG